MGNILLGQVMPSHVIYNAKGKKVSYGKMMKSLQSSEIILFGEYHDNPISHWLQYEITKELNDKKQLVLGAEMIEADNQDELNQYLKGDINYDELDSMARLWPNYKTDYAPLVDFAKDNALTFIATNIPRRYARMVYNGGYEALDTLSERDKSWIAPLPITLDTTQAYNQFIASQEYGSPSLLKAQSTKDATMAYFIYKNFKKGDLFIHYNGAYHSNMYGGILWYLKKMDATLNYATITTVSQDNVKKLLKENRHLADFIICVDSDMTTTY